MHRKIFFTHRIIVLLLIAIFSLPKFSSAQNPAQSFTIENYYKVKWGYADEFIALYKKNHYPLLKKLIEKGDLLKLTIDKPRLHSSEDSRWDFRVTLVFKNAILAYDNTLTDPYKKTIYPDQATYIKEEQRRFEILIAHWDVPVESVNPDN